MAAQLLSYPLMYQVSQETVLNDRAGLYLNNGPYLLVYSRDVETRPSMAPVPPIVETRTWPVGALVRLVGSSPSAVGGYIFFADIRFVTENYCQGQRVPQKTTR